MYLFFFWWDLRSRFLTYPGSRRGERNSKRNSLNVQISLLNNKLSREDLISNGSSTLFKMGQQPLLTLPGTLWLWLRSRPNPAEPSQTTPRWHFDFREPFDSSHIYQAESHFSCVWAPSIKKKKMNALIMTGDMEINALSHSVHICAVSRSRLEFYECPRSTLNHTWWLALEVWGKTKFIQMRRCFNMQINNAQTFLLQQWCWK